MKNIKAMRSIKQLALLAFLGLGLPSCAKEEANNTPEPVVSDYHQVAANQFIQAEGVTYAYRELGPKTGDPIVMLSPLGGTMDDWDPAITNGLAARYKVILFDIPGAGLSGGQTPDSIAGMAKDVIGFIKALGLQKVNLVGFSMGSFIAQQIVLTEPGLVNKMVLTGTGPKGALGLSDLPTLLAAAANLNAEDRFLKFGFTDSEASIKAGKLSYARIQKRTTDRDLPASEASGGAQLHAVLNWAQATPGALDELKQVKQPVLIIQGQEDIPVPVQNAENMAQSLPNSRLVVYPDSGHAALFQNATAFVREALDFFAE